MLEVAVSLAVSTDWRFLNSEESIKADKTAKYTPIVEIKVELKASSENLNNTQVFPTPESPINRSLNK